MAKIIDVNGEAVEFPDSMSDEQIASVLKKQVKAPVSKSKDLGMSVLSAVPQGVMDAGAGSASGFGHMLGPVPGYLIDSAIKWYRDQIPQWKSQTTGGKYAGAGVRGLTGGLVAGPRGALSGFAGGVGGQLGSDLTGGSPLGRLVGAGVGALTPNAPALVGGLTQRRIQAATNQLTPDDWAAAQAAQRNAAQQGIQVTGPEAIGQKAPDLLAKQLVTEQHPKSAGLYSPLMLARPEQVNNAVGGMLAKTGPAAPDKRLLGAAVQENAKGVLERGRQYALSQSRPSYASVEGEGTIAGITGASSVPEGIRKSRVYQQTLGEARGDAASGLSANAPAYHLDTLDKVQKFLHGKASAAEVAGDNAKAAIYKSQRKQILDEVYTAFPDYQVAVRAYERGIASQKTPREQGVIGQLASTDDPVAQFGALKDPARSGALSTKGAASDLKNPNPEQYQQLIRTGLENEFDTAMKTLQTGGQQFGGARFARQVRATPQTRQNIETAIGSLPDGPQLVTGWNRLLDALELTGNRLPVGSRTAFNQQQLSETGTAGILGQTLSTQPLGWLERVEQSMSAKSMAKIFTDPDSVAKLKELAVTKPNSARASVLIGSIFGAQAGEQ